MANLTVRNLPDKTKETLRIHAAQSGVSLEAYARHLLQAAANQQEFKPLNILALAEQYFGPDKGVELELPTRGSNRSVVDFD
jgi:plasmid stability protein